MSWISWAVRRNWHETKQHTTISPQWLSKSVFIVVSLRGYDDVTRSWIRILDIAGSTGRQPWRLCGYPATLLPFVFYRSYYISLFHILMSLCLFQPILCHCKFCVYDCVVLQNKITYLLTYKYASPKIKHFTFLTDEVVWCSWPNRSTRQDSPSSIRCVYVNTVGWVRKMRCLVSNHPIEICRLYFQGVWNKVPKLWRMIKNVSVYTDVKSGWNKSLYFVIAINNHNYSRDFPLRLYKMTNHVLSQVWRHCGFMQGISNELPHDSRANRWYHWH